ncbi:PD-(D/E)XK nuclease superfamily protein [Singulisphaera sp. GP187]|nr:PD-(D/E)XK nuclease superfamily protein [Singulisphaera sp. GP187]
MAAVIEWPGFRRRLVARIAGWTRAERSATADPTENHEPTLRAQWAIFGRYREVLRELHAEDDEGLATWASKTLLKTPPKSFKSLNEVVFLDPSLDSPAPWRVVQFAQAQSRSVTLTLTLDSDPSLGEVYGEAASIRARLLDSGFQETKLGPDSRRPKGLRDVEHELFRSDGHLRPRLRDPDGLKVAGAPQGEGMALVLAREIKRLIERGTDPEEILVLFRRWDDDADLILKTLQAWGLPAAAERRVAFAAAPVIAALRLAMVIPGEQWEATTLIQWLRHGQVRPPWAAEHGPLALAKTAAAIRAIRVFRGLDPIRRALDRTISEARSQGKEAPHVVVARAVLDRLAAVIGTLDQPGPWHYQCEGLRNLASSLGIGAIDDPLLEALWDALDEHGAVLEGLGQAGQTWTWTRFTREVESLTAELAGPPLPCAPGTIRLAEVDEVAGSRAPWIFLANLGEGMFPTRDSIDLSRTTATEEEAQSVAQANPAFAREMLRFLGVVGSADTGLVLAYATSDAQGQELLRAGFLDDLLGLFTPEAVASPRVHESHRRFDPTLTDWPELAGAPADARVRAVALACTQREFTSLRALARQPRHRRILEGTAAAIRVAQSRLQSTHFGAYDGRIGDSRVIERIVKKFGPDYTFSPSQLETFLFCPFQFYLRYMLKLAPVDERDELEEDYTERGSRVHHVLELLERMLAQEPGNRLERAEALILNERRSEPKSGSDIDLGIHEIEQRRMIRTLRRYVRQHDAYESAQKSGNPAPYLFEVDFGLEGGEDESFPSLVLGAGADSVRLQGKIDRIDLVSCSDLSAYRVIDYKTGACPSKNDVKDAIYLQLPLYALAVERIILKTAEVRLHDVGYWALAADGFKSITLKNWDQDREALETYVTDVVGQLRQGQFVVDSCKDDCIQRCEYSSVCRIRQVRAARKVREGEPSLELKV